jgi:hypothetical protein
MGEVLFLFGCFSIYYSWIFLYQLLRGFPHGVDCDCARIEP